MADLGTLCQAHVLLAGTPEFYAQGCSLAIEGLDCVFLLLLPEGSRLLEGVDSGLCPLTYALLSGGCKSGTASLCSCNKHLSGFRDINLEVPVPSGPAHLGAQNDKAGPV